MKIATMGAVICLSVGFVCSAEAKNHCDAVLDTAESIFQTLLGEDTKTVCEEQLEAARELLSQGREQAVECGCDMLVRGFEGQIKSSKSTDYECWNKRQGIRSTINSSVGDMIESCQ